MFKVPEKNRVTTGRLRTDSSYGRNGVFEFSPTPKCQYVCIASDEGGWEHVSVEVRASQIGNKYQTRYPTWNEMCRIKNIFWDEEDTVLQFHPAKSEYVNIHEHVLHLWRKSDTNAELPPSEFV
jgi:hypothetical protein